MSCVLQLDFFANDADVSTLPGLSKQRGHDFEIDLSIYDRFVVAFSGGKDYAACLLHLFEQGVDQGARQTSPFRAGKDSAA